jgi:hypothetical protein
MELVYIHDCTGWSVHQLPALDVPTWHDFKDIVPQLRIAMQEQNTHARSRL